MSSGNLFPWLLYNIALRNHSRTLLITGLGGLQNKVGKRLGRCFRVFGLRGLRSLVLRGLRCRVQVLNVWCYSLQTRKVGFAVCSLVLYLPKGPKGPITQ